MVMMMVKLRATQTGYWASESQLRPSYDQPPYGNGHSVIVKHRRVEISQK